MPQSVAGVRRSRLRSCRSCIERWRSNTFLLAARPLTMDRIRALSLSHAWIQLQKAALHGGLISSSRELSPLLAVASAFRRWRALECLPQLSAFGAAEKLRTPLGLVLRRWIDAQSRRHNWLILGVEALAGASHDPPTYPPAYPPAIIGV